MKLLLALLAFAALSLPAAHADMSAPDPSAFGSSPSTEMVSLVLGGLIASAIFAGGGAYLYSRGTPKNK
ncbi:MAG: hypothetical protein U0105_09345 [Candidatus Obscuribacterales bacterium]